MKKKIVMKVSLAFYDFVIYAILDTVLLWMLHYTNNTSDLGIIMNSTIGLITYFGAREIGHVYRQIWRYGGIQCYIKLLMCDAVAFLVFFAVVRLLPIEQLPFALLLAFSCMNTLVSLTIRMIYRYAYKCGNRTDFIGKVLRILLYIFAFGKVRTEADPDRQKIKVAILGAGVVGVGLAEDLINNPKAQYAPRFFIDSDLEKVGRDIHGLRVVSESDATMDELKQHEIQEVIFAVPNMPSTRKLELYDYYKKAGFGIKIFDYPTVNVPGRKRQLREFEISDLLFRDERDIITETTREYYRNKVILITGGGGSIGSELCRQLAKMEPRQIIVLDVYENCAYDLEQSLLYAYKGKVDVKVEIVSITNKRGLARVYKKYKPDITINAAAHKHVPLMQNNCIEAAENNIFGTLNVIQCCEEYGCGRFMMVSTDKAVNPTNVMGATKRMCEMIMQAYSTRGKVVCSATRFGNVLGSAGSVIPLFKRQIAAGGPVTVTDRRIIRYFMTIPEASQLVLTSGAMAKNGDLFVLDMGKPVKIWDLAENMIRMSGVDDVDVIETGLRPGEKLYEELLVQSDTLTKTDNNLIFIEHEEPVSMEQLAVKLTDIKNACETDIDENVVSALRIAVPTFKTPEEVNARVS